MSESQLDENLHEQTAHDTTVENTAGNAEGLARSAVEPQASDEDGNVCKSRHLLLRVLFCCFPHQLRLSMSHTIWILLIQFMIQASTNPKSPTKPSLKRKRDGAVHQSPQAAKTTIASGTRTPVFGSRDVKPQSPKSSSEKALPDPVEGWVLNETWPSEYFDPEEPKESSEHDSWLELMMSQRPPVVEFVEINGFKCPKPGRKVSPSLSRKHSASLLDGSSETNSVRQGVPQYRDPRYPTLLATKGVFMTMDDSCLHEPPEKAAELGNQMLTRPQKFPENTLFRDDIFSRTCKEISKRNEAMIIQDVSRLLVPSAKNLAIFGDTHLDILTETVNEAWANSIPIEGPRPQPDYAVGFKKSAFSEKQMKKLAPFIGSLWDTSYFVATMRMCFPFLTCEVKCGSAALELADRQNAHAASVAVRGVVELYRIVHRHAELNCEVLAFSVSHDDDCVRIYAHYPLVVGDKVTYHSHRIRFLIYTEMGGRDKWATYQFTKNVYDVWIPIHLKRICSAIDQLPSDISFEVAQVPVGYPAE